MSVPPVPSVGFPSTSAGKPEVSPVRGTLISLGFWLCLLGATASYGLVVLSPKIVRWSERNREVADNQERLLGLQEEVDFWTRLTDELERNDEFRESLLSPVSGSATPSGRFIPVDSTLRYQPRQTGRAIQSAPPQPSLFLRICERVAASTLLQVLILAGSAALLLFSFTSLLESRSARSRRRLRRIRPAFLGRLSRLGRRYVSVRRSVSGETPRKSSTIRSNRLITDV